MLATPDEDENPYLGVPPIADESAAGAVREVFFSLSQPLGMDVDRETLVVTGLAPGGQAQRAGVVLHLRIIAGQRPATESYEELLARRQAQIDAGATTFGVRFETESPPAVANQNEIEDPSLGVPPIADESADPDDDGAPTRGEENDESARTTGERKNPLIFPMDKPPDAEPGWPLSQYQPRLEKVWLDGSNPEARRRPRRARANERRSTDASNSRWRCRSSCFLRYCETSRGSALFCARSTST